MHSYWQTQSSTKPLFPDIEWSKPEQISQRGKLTIVGGNKLGFVSVADSYQTALNSGAGQVRVLLPDCLKKQVPPTMTDVVFADSNPSGGLSKKAKNDLLAIANWSNGLLMIGDAGRNSETSVIYSDVLREYSGNVTLTRDAIDLIRQDAQAIVERPNTVFVISFAQLQKIFQAVYYPIILTFSMQLMQLVEATHKFTVTYPVTLAVLHQNNMIIASGGQVTTTPWTDPMAVWRGVVATNIATYLLWSPNSHLESASTSLFAS